MTETQELVTKLLSEGAKEFPHQWDGVGWPQCSACHQELRDNNEKDDCPELLRAALDLTLKERDEMRCQRNDLSDEMERCHRMLDVHYGEDLSTTTLTVLEERVEQLIAEATATRQQLAEALARL